MSGRNGKVSFTRILRDERVSIPERLEDRGVMFLRVRKRQTGSPGSTLFSDRAWGQIAGRLQLSEREGEIVRRVFDDKTEFAIATELGISPHTVHTHVERLHRKLGVADRVQLILCVMEEFLRLPTSTSARAQPPGLPMPSTVLG